MDFKTAINLMNSLNDAQREFKQLLDIESRTTERDFYFVEIECVRLKFSKSEVAKILDEKKRLLENNIRELAKQLSELK